MDKVKPVIVIKKKGGGHGGHHGGAWKVAYADFVTAMMALFIVLWLMNSNTKVQEAVAGYFRDPKGDGKLAGTEKAGAGQAGKVLELKKDDMKHLESEIQKALKSLPEFQKIKDQVAMTITSEGLRIELMETEKGTFFESGNAKPTPACTDLLRSLATELGKLPNRVLIEGHTDAQPYVGSATYSNWELSTDRANQARIVMQATGLKPGQLQQVRGFADQNLRDPSHPNDAANRRISVVVPYLGPKHGEQEEKKDGDKGGETEPAHGEKIAEHAAQPAEAKPAPAAGHQKKQ